MAALPTQKIFVSLDAILDSRIGTIAKINQELATKVLEGNYIGRESDNFPYVDKETFDREYKNRDIETLKHSIATAMLPFLKNLCDQLYEQAIVMPYHSGPEIVLNVHPYDVDPELADMFKKLIGVWMVKPVPISVISVKPEELSPEHCVENYALMILYDYNAWLDLHLPAMEKVKMSNVTMFVPAIYFRKQPTKEELTELMKTAMHPFVSLELMVKPVLDLNLIDVKYFSILQESDIYELEHFKIKTPPQAESSS